MRRYWGLHYVPSHPRLRSSSCLWNIIPILSLVNFYSEAYHIPRKPAPVKCLSSVLWCHHGPGTCGQMSLPTALS